MKYKIILVPFPFDDFSSSKVRPAVCLTEAIGQHQHIVIAFISSRLPSVEENTDLIIKESSKGFSTTGLKLNSVVRLHRLITIPLSLVMRELGTLSPIYRLDLNKKIKLLFNI